MKTAKSILNSLLQLELATQARRLHFVEGDLVQKVDEELLHACLSVLNDLSIKKDEVSKKLLIAITALLWNYKDLEWTGLQNYLVLFLSRAGFGPSSIMLDSGYSADQKSYSFSQSLLNEFAITVAHAENEIEVGEQTFLLTDFQRQVWDDLENNELIGISAPTSAGKSYVIVLKAMEMLLEKGGTVIYIVPTLSLVSQVMADFRMMLDRFGLNDYALESSFNFTQYSPKSIFVLTQEKAIAAFSQTEIPFKDVRLLVVDEIQNVERVATKDDIRSKILYDLMQEFRNTSHIDRTIVSGPLIAKIDELSEDIFGKEAVKRETSSSPVLNLTYSIVLKNKMYYLKVFSDLLQQPLELKITNQELIRGYGGKEYNEEYLKYLDELTRNFEQECVLIFSPNPKACGRIADYMRRRSEHGDNEYLDDLAGFIAATVHKDYTLVEAVKKGIAYHHGKMPSHVRPLIEYVIKKGHIKVIIATTTLLQGVNLPVQNIIIRNPNLYLKKKADSAALSRYELANLRGRAGRLLKDFVGRTFILDEKSFLEKENSQLELFNDNDKQLEVGYGKKYDEYKKEIKKDILDQVGSTMANREYSLITTYVRQAVLKYGIDSQMYLSRVGIQVKDKELNEMLEVLQSLRVDKRICARNRYWDPVDLNKIHTESGRYILPTSPREMNNASKLKSILLYMEANFPVYYERFIKVSSKGPKDVLIALCILADKWSKEIPLVDILNDGYYDSTEKIDDAIDKLEGTVSFKLAQLIKPIYDIKAPDEMYPRYLEMGAYLPVTRRLIEMNIPRETAIYLRDRLRNSSDDREALVAEIRRIRPTLPYWYRIQLATV